MAAGKSQRVYVNQLSGGLNTNIATSQLDEKDAQALMNMRWNEGKILLKRDGHQPVFPGLTAPKELARFVLSTKRELTVIDGTSFKVLQPSATTPSWTTVAGAIPTSSYYSMPQIKSRQFIWSGGQPYFYDGATLTSTTKAPFASGSVYYKGYNHAWGVATQESRLYASTLADSADFTNDPSATTSGPDPDNATDVPGATDFTGSLPDVAQFIDFSPSDGERVIVAFEFQDYLIVCKETSIWSMNYDGATGKPVVQLVTRAAGCVSAKSVAAYSNSIAFLTDQGPVTLGNEKNFGAALRTNLLSDKITDIVRNINPAAWRKAAAIYYDRMWIISVPYGASTTINKVLMLDTRFGGWAEWNTIYASSWVNFRDTQNQAHLYFLKDGDTSISEMVPGYYYDGSNAIEAYWESKAIDAGILDVTKRFTFLTLFMRNIGSSAIAYMRTELTTLDPVPIFENSVTSSGVGSQQWGSAWLGHASDVANDSTSTSSNTADDAWRTQLNEEARTFTVRVYNNKPGENMYIAGYSLEFNPLPPYYFDQDHSF